MNNKVTIYYTYSLLDNGAHEWKYREKQRRRRKLTGKIFIMEIINKKETFWSNYNHNRNMNELFAQLS